MTFADRQRDRRARGQTGLAETMARLEAVNPSLREYAEDVWRRGQRLPVLHDPVRVAAELREGTAALRVLNGHRALAQHQAVLRDDPDGPVAPADIAAIARWIHDTERCGTVRPRPWARLLAQEGRR